MTFLRQSFSEHSGKPSSSRIIRFLFVVDVMAVWTINSLRDAHYVMDATVLLAVLTVLGIGAYQRTKEGKGNDTCQSKSP